MEESKGNRLLKQIKDLAEVAGIKTEEYARVSRKRLDVLSLDRELGKEKGDLGNRVYELAHHEGPVDILQDVTVKACIARIEKLEASLAECEQEIQRIRETSQGKTSEARQRQAGAKPQPPAGG